MCSKQRLTREVVELKAALVKWRSGAGRIVTAVRAVYYTVVEDDRSRWCPKPIVAVIVNNIR